MLFSAEFYCDKCKQKMVVNSKEKYIQCLNPNCEKRYVKYKFPEIKLEKIKE